MGSATTSTTTIEEECAGGLHRNTLFKFLDASKEGPSASVRRSGNFGQELC